MPRPTDGQRLNIDQCDTSTPPNASQYLGTWFCDAGWMANTTGSTSEHYSLDTLVDGKAIPARTKCIKVILEDLGREKQPVESVAAGLGAKRYFFESSAIDRNYTRADYYNTYVIRSNWEENSPHIKDKFRAANGLFWIWTKTTDGIDEIGYLRSPKASTTNSVHGTALTVDTAPLTNPRSLGPFRVSIMDNGINANSLEGTANVSLYPDYDTNTSGVRNENSFWYPYLEADDDGALVVSTSIKNKSNTLVESIIKKDEWFYDHTFELVGPMRKDLATSNEITGGVKYYKVAPVYNYYVPKYESLLSDTTAKEIKETLLPNIYVLLDDNIYDDSSPTGDEAAQQTIYKKHIHHGDSRADNPITPNNTSIHKELAREYSYWDLNSSTGSTSEFTDDNAGITQKSRYFTEFSNQHYKTNFTFTSLENNFTNIFISHDQTLGSNAKGYLNTHNGKKEAFPMYVEIEFSTPHAGNVTEHQQPPASFTEQLKDTKMSCYLMKAVIRGELTETFNEKEYIEFLERTEETDKNIYSLTDATGPYAKKRREIDITDWFDKDITNDFASPFLNKNLPDSPENSRFIFLGSTCSVLDNERAISAALITLENQSHDAAVHHRISATSFINMMEGKKAKTETVFYRIEKLDSKGDLVQNFYLPNSNDIDVYNFVDTQVKYGKEYTYKIYTWMIVYGLKYKYTDINKLTNPAGQSYMLEEPVLNAKYPETNITVEYKQSIKLIEVPYFEQTVKVLDTPPVHPNVEIIPYNGINNKLMINLNSGAGRIKQEPVTIEAADRENLEDFFLAQNRFTDQTVLEYATDDFAVKYRIYRLDSHPSSYSDFARGIIRDIDTPTAVSASLDEKVIPNKTYWYTFRAIDIHEHLSYPSPIYQVQLVDDGSSIYPLIDTVELKKKTDDIDTPTKKLKRLIQIIPSANHVYLANDKEEEFLAADGVRAEERYKRDRDFKLGTAATETLWDKKFKIRLTSKKTGRKVDINVKFENKHLKIVP